MSVFNSQIANSTTFNNAFLSRLSDSTTVGIVGLANVNPASGTSITNIQREFNALGSFLGLSPNQVFNALPAWTNTDIGTAGDSVRVRSDALTAAFNQVLGHSHDNTLGSGGPISALTLSNFNQFFAEFQTDVFASAAGLSDDVTSVFTGLTPGGGAATVGVPTTAPYNRVELRTDPNGDNIEEPGGKLVYGRVTESAGTWTLTYFYEDSFGVETAYSLPSQDIRIFWREVFNAQTRPTFGTETGFLGSFDATADIVDASVTQAGKVNLVAQSFAGLKTFADGAVFSEAMSIEKQDVASAATITALSNTNSFVKLTGATATELQGILSASTAIRLVLYNASSATLTVKHQNAGASAANRIITPDGNDVSVVASSSVEFLYDVSDSRWRIISTQAGAGSFTPQVEYRTISVGEAAAESLTLANTPTSSSLVMVDAIGGCAQEYTVDYSVTGTTLSWAGLGLTGLVAGDKLRISYFS